MGRRRVVLVVDDQAMTRDVVGAMLDEDEVEVHTAADADTALALAEELRPDVVVLDVTMPGRDGIAVCRELSERYGAAAPRVVMLTGRSEPEVRAAAAAAGAAAYLVKPFSAVDLYHAVTEERVRGA